MEIGEINQKHNGLSYAPRYSPKLKAQLNLFCSIYFNRP